MKQTLISASHSEMELETAIPLKLSDTEIYVSVNLLHRIQFLFAFQFVCLEDPQLAVSKLTY